MLCKHRKTLTGLVFGLLLLAAGTLPAQQQQLAQQDEDQPKAVAVGDEAPDFELQSLGEEKVKLSDRFGEGGHPVVLLFSRAHW